MIPKYWIPLHTQYDTTETKFCMVIKLRGKLLQRPLRPGPVAGSERDSNFVTDAEARSVCGS